MEGGGKEGLFFSHGLDHRAAYQRRLLQTVAHTRWNEAEIIDSYFKENPNCFNYHHSEHGCPCDICCGSICDHFNSTRVGRPQVKSHMATASCVSWAQNWVSPLAKQKRVERSCFLRVQIINTNIFWCTLELAKIHICNNTENMLIAAFYLLSLKM